MQIGTKISLRSPCLVLGLKIAQFVLDNSYKKHSGPGCGWAHLSGTCADRPELVFISHSFQSSWCKWPAKAAGFLHCVSVHVSGTQIQDTREAPVLFLQNLEVLFMLSVSSQCREHAWECKWGVLIWHRKKIRNLLHFHHANLVLCIFILYNFLFSLNQVIPKWYI